MSKRSILTVISAAVLLLTGCNGEAKTEPTPSPSQTPSATQESPSSSPDEKTPKELALDQLTGFLKERDESYRRAELSEGMGDFAEGPAYAVVSQRVGQLQKISGRELGQYVHELSNVRNNGNKITIINCQNSSDVKIKVGKKIRPLVFFGDDDKPIGDHQVMVYELMRKSPESPWKVATEKLKWEEKC